MATEEQLQGTERTPLLSKSTRRQSASTGTSATSLVAVASKIHKYPSSPKHLHRVTLRLEYLISELIPQQVKNTHITLPSRNNIITDAAVLACKEAGRRKPFDIEEDGNDVISKEIEEEQWTYCVPFCLLLCKKRFIMLSRRDPADSDVMLSRSLACEFLAKEVLNHYKGLSNWEIGARILARRWNLGNGHWKKGTMQSEHTSALELGIDLHATWFCSDAVVQKTVQALWNGHLCQELDEDGNVLYSIYSHAGSRSFLDHLHPSRLKVPKYQNVMSIIVSLTFLVIYSIVTLTHDYGDISPLEVIMYVFVLGYIFDESAKIYKAGMRYILLDIWKVISVLMYSLFAASMILRLFSVMEKNPAKREHYIYWHYAYCLSPASILVWIRCLVVFDNYPIFGSSIVVLRTLMAESATFFLLLGFIIAAFTQSFLVIDAGDGRVSDFWSIIDSLMRGFLMSPDFDMGLEFGVVGLILYELYIFLVAVILLNMLVALYAQAYASVTDDTVNQFLTARAGKTVNFLRAPDEFYYVVPFNLIETFFLVPFEPCLPRKAYEWLNRHVMTVIFAPSLAFIAWYESRIDAPKMLDDRPEEIRALQLDHEAQISRVQESNQVKPINNLWDDSLQVCDSDDDLYSEPDDQAYKFGDDQSAEVAWRQMLIKKVSNREEDVEDTTPGQALLRHLLQEVRGLRDQVQDLKRNVKQGHN